VYLTKKQIVVCQTSSRQAEYVTEFKICDDIQDIAELESASGDAEIICTDYHIVYSTTYCVPVLYFNAYYAGNNC
jgi:Autophagocytosis associated protein, active-site domain